MHEYKEGGCFSTNSRTVCTNLFCVFQLAGTAVFSIGLWLRFDQKTKGLFEGPDAPYVFYTGKMLSVLNMHII